MPTLGVLLLTLALIAGVGCTAKEPNPPGIVHSGGLGPAVSTQTLPLEIAPGRYVEGTVESGSGRIQLDLVDSRLILHRRLVRDGSGRNAFRFVMEPGLQFRVSAVAGPVDYRIEITRSITPSYRTTQSEAPISRRLKNLVSELGQDRALERFWAEVAASGTPLVEPAGEGQALITYLWRGPAKNVLLVGTPTPHREWLFRLEGTDLFFKSFTVPATYRMPYRLAPDVPTFDGTDAEIRQTYLATLQVDPLNKHPWPEANADKFTQESNTVLPTTPAQPWSTLRGAPEGQRENVILRSEVLGNTRNITLYRSFNYAAGDADTLFLIIFDGADYLDKVNAPLILDNLVAAGRIPQVVAAFVPHPDRGARFRELTANPKHAEFLATELLPEMERHAGLSSRPENTALIGSSLGGLAAATGALAYPERFGNAVALSGSFWWPFPSDPDAHKEHVLDLIQNSPRKDVRFYLCAGIYELGSRTGILEPTRRLRDALRAKGYTVHHSELAAGHDYFSWRGSLAEALLALFERDAATLPATPPAE